MSTIELRNIITERLSQVEDEVFLNAIKTIIETKIFDNTYDLSNYQKERIKIARLQLKNGKTISHQNIKKEVEQWLNSK